MAGKSQVPRGATKKVPCKKCGSLFYQILIAGSNKLTDECPLCDPKHYRGDRK